MYHSTLGLRVIKKKRRSTSDEMVHQRLLSARPVLAAVAGDVSERGPVDSEHAAPRPPAIRDAGRNMMGGKREALDGNPMLGVEECVISQGHL